VRNVWIEATAGLLIMGSAADERLKGVENVGQID
jgi:hypothetical protein